MDAEERNSELQEIKEDFVKTVHQTQIRDEGVIASIAAGIQNPNFDMSTIIDAYYKNQDNQRRQEKHES